MAKRDEKRDPKSTRKVGATPNEHWKDDPDEHDYPAASDYLSLLLPDASVGPVVEALKGAPDFHRKAKDLLRASRLALLDESNPHVADDLAKVRRGGYLSPVLIVRGSLYADLPLTVADGYHRICASFHLDENADIPCRMADSPQPSGASGDDAAGTGNTAAAP